MSNTPVNNDQKQQQQQPAPSQSASPAAPTKPAASAPFNYAAAAAKSKQQQQQQQQAGAQSDNATPSDAMSRSGSTTPGAASGLNGNGPAAAAGTDARRGANAVSMAKPAVSGGAGGINFGSVHDSSAALSSSPAVQPKSGQHLQGDKPALFGSVEAAKKVVGFGGPGAPAAPSSTAPRQPVDFQKLFQGGGSKANKPAAAESQNGVKDSSAPTPPVDGQAPSSPAISNRNGPAAAATPQPKPPSTPGNPSLLATPQHHPNAASQPFEPQRSPSHHFSTPSVGMRNPSGAMPAPFQPHQQPRSPHLGQSPMQPMMAASQPHWQQPHAAYYPMGAGAYGYQYAGGHPPQWQQQQQQQQAHPQQQQQQQQQQPPQQGYEMSAASRSPHASPMVPHHQSSASASISSPASSRAQAAPFSPSTAPSSIASPSIHGGHLGLGRPPPAFQMPSANYGHSPSHSFSGANAMSPSARQFEPAQKRASSAIRIVNPDTKATIDIKREGKDSPVPSPATAAAITPTPPPSAPAAAASPAPPSPAAPAPAAAAATSTPAPASSKGRIETANEFQARVKALAEENQRKKQAAKEAAAKADEEEAERKKKAEADAEAARKREEEDKAQEAERARKAAAEAEQKEEEARKAAQAQEDAARQKDEADAKAAESAKAKAAADEKAEQQKADDVIDESAQGRQAESAKLDAEESVATGEKSGAEAAKDVLSTPRSVADIERMAREASSVPSTPLEPVGRTPLFPTTPRTPGTPGFAGLPAKPMSSMASSASINGAGSSITLDSAQLEKRRKPAALDTAAAQRTPASGAAGSSSASTEPPASAASQSLGSARFIDDISKVAYPDSIQSPRAELNKAAERGKFRYDREFLLQFMGVYSEKPVDMPPLASIGMEQGQMGAGGGRGAAGRRTSQMGPPAGGRGQGLGLGGLGAGGAFGRTGSGSAAGGMGSFSHPPKTSEERFAQSSSGMRTGGAFGNSGPMGSFNASSRTQPLSRGGSGSNALPSREMMGTGVPAGGRTASRRGRTREPGGGRGGEGKVNPPEKGGPTIPMDQVVPLAHSDTRWQAGAKVSADSPELVQRKVKALLNKLTVEKFASISDQILEWANKSTEETDGRTLRQVIALIFEKATDEAAWSEMYAQLCRKLQEKLSLDVQDEGLRTADGKPVTGGHLFRKYLLTRCQEDFERGWAIRDAMVDAAKSKEAEDTAKKATNEKAEADAKEAAERGEKTEDNKEAELMSDEYYAAQKAKRRGLGLVRFIGELFKLSMLTERIMHNCIKKLLHNATDPEEEEIESLCKLVTTVGRQLDTEKARGHIDIYFQRMQQMSKSESINSRMRFMILDVIEMRAAGWKGKQESAGPKSIAQIHEDAAKQKQQAELELAARSRSGGPPSRGGSRRGQQRGDFPGPGQPVGPDGWTSVGGAPPPPRPSRTGDMSAFGKGIERSGSGRPLSLGMGPQNVFAKKQQKTSEDGSKPPSRTSSSANMFEMLGQAEAREERPKLNIAPRTKPMPGSGGDDEEEDEDEEEDGEGEGEEEGDDATAAAASSDGPADMDDETAARKIGNDVKEYLEIRDVKEGALALESLPVARRAAFVCKITETALNKKEDDVRVVGKLFAQARESSLLRDSDYEEGFKEAGLAMLDDISIDVPSVYKFMAILLVASGLPEEAVEKLADLVEGEGIKTPKQKLLEKVAEQRAEA